MQSRYEEAKVLLRKNGIFVNNVLVSRKTGDEIEGLWLQVPPILAPKKVKAISDILGDKYHAYYLPNLLEIHIRLKGMPPNHGIE